MSCRLYAAWALWLQGYPEQALVRSHEGLTIAEARAHPYSRAWALSWAAIIRQYRREVHATQERAEALIALSTEQGFALTLALGTILRGSALAAQEAGEPAIVQIYQGLAAWRATGTETLRPYFLGLLAEAQGKVGRAAEGLIVLAEALTRVDETEERWCEAELYRLRGELLLQGDTDSDDEAESCFHQALDVARRQQAKSLELRAAMSLSRLWQRQGKRDEAPQLLAEVYTWFTEGFDTPDLQEAQALLQAMEGGKAQRQA
jgi:predicted ATPase